MSTNCPFCMQLVYGFNWGQYIRCNSCIKNFCKAKCPHCYQILLFGEESKYLPGQKVSCTFCNNIFQQLPCANCQLSIVYKNADYKEGKVISCPYVNCQSKFQQLTCCHCLGSIVFKDANYKESQVVTCPYSQCNQKFQQLSCGHCNTSIVYSKSNYSVGSTVKCPESNCGKLFQQILCSHCRNSIVFKQNNYKYLQRTKCPYHNCQKLFQQVVCKFCSRDIVFKNADYKRGTEIVCPYSDCKQKFFPSGEVVIKKSSKKTASVTLNLDRKKFIQKASQFVKNQIVKGQKFYDTKFPPNDSSIGTMKEKYSWARAKDILGNDVVFFCGIDEDDVKQGSLGNCWFLSAIAVLTKFPNLLEKLFLTRDINSAGIYEVILCKNGKWQNIYVDDYFPCYLNSKRLAFTKSNESEIWVNVLEKVYAKFHGSYHGIESGFAGDALSDLTGYPVKRYTLNEENCEKLISAGRLFPLLDLHIQQKHCLIITTRKDLDKDSTGLVPSHCYSVLDSNSKYKLLKLRNPWAHKEWIGKWSDKWSGWSDSLKYELKWEDKDDGEFYIEWKDVLGYFRGIAIGLIDENYTEFRSQVKVNHCFELTLGEYAKVFGGIHQVRYNKNTKYIPAGFVFVHEQTNKVVHYEGMKLERTLHNVGENTHGNNSDLSKFEFALSLQPGKYLVIPIVNYMNNNNLRKELIFSLHVNNRSFSMKERVFSIDNFPKIVLTSNPEPEKRTTQKWRENEFIMDRYWNSGDMMYFVTWAVQNPKCSKVTFTFKFQLDNMCVVYGTTANMEFDVFPGERKFIGWFSRMSNEKYSINYTYSWKTTFVG